MINDVPKMMNDDWFSKFVRRLRLSPVSVALIFAFISIATSLVMAYRFGALLPGPRSQGLLAEPGAWANSFLLSPVIVGFFVWIQEAADTIFQALQKGNIISSQEDVKRVIFSVEKQMKDRRLVYLSLALALIFCAFFIVTNAYPQQATFSSWITINPTMVWIAAPFNLLVAYCLFMALLDLLIVVRGIRELFGCHAVRIEPRHPDHAGGLGFIGKFAANLGFLVGVAGLTIFANSVTTKSWMFTYPSDYVILLVLTAYLCLAPFVFFGPLFSVHRAMRSFRDARVKDVSEQFDDILTQWSTISERSSEEIEVTVSKVRQLDEMHKIAGAFPTWPFNTSSLSKFFGLTLSPLVPALISAVANLVIKRP